MRHIALRTSSRLCSFDGTDTFGWRRGEAYVQRILVEDAPINPLRRGTEGRQVTRFYIFGFRKKLRERQQHHDGLVNITLLLQSLVAHVNHRVEQLVKVALSALQGDERYHNSRYNKEKHHPLWPMGDCPRSLIDFPGPSKFP